MGLGLAFIGLRGYLLRRRLLVNIINTSRAMVEMCDITVTYLCKCDNILRWMISAVNVWFFSLIEEDCCRVWPHIVLRWKRKVYYTAHALCMYFLKFSLNKSQKCSVVSWERELTWRQRFLWMVQSTVPNLAIESPICLPAFRHSGNSFMHGGHHLTKRKICIRFNYFSN